MRTDRQGPRKLAIIYSLNNGIKKKFKKERWEENREGREWKVFAELSWLTKILYKKRIWNILQKKNIELIIHVNELNKYEDILINNDNI